MNMFKQKLIEHSPIRILEKSIHGGVGKGNLGVFTARKGVGKTACLVHVAIDKLLRNQNVLHLSFTDNPHHIENWYRQVFQEVSNKFKLENAFTIYDEILQKRLIMHFTQKNGDFDYILDSINQVEAGADFHSKIVIIDGYSFEGISEDDLKLWKQFAINHDVAIWFSATLHRHNPQFDQYGIPTPVNRFAELFSVIIMLEPMHDYIDMKLLKDHDFNHLDRLRLKLDPKSMLISNHRI